MFGYSPTVGPGNLIFSIAAVAGKDPYGNSYPQGLSSTVGNITTTSLSTTALNITEGPLLFYGSSSAGGEVFAAGSSGNWTVPAGVTMVTATLYAGAGNGSENSQGAGGGGGECAVQTFTVIGGNSLAYSVGNAGQNTTFNGITAHAGTNASGSTPGSGGTGSSAATAFAGGAGGLYGLYAGEFEVAGGGGASGSPTQPGGSGSPLLGGTTGPGGGAGGFGAGSGGSPQAGFVPGGGGGGDTPGDGVAGAGAGGQLVLSYASEPSPTDLLLAIASVAGSDTNGNSWGVGLTLEPSAAPATPSAGCILYYDSGILYAVGPSGDPVAIATT
jgi:hypothetical protein